jgi:hypothetical protein
VYLHILYMGISINQVVGAKDGNLAVNLGFGSDCNDKRALT